MVLDFDEIIVEGKGLQIKERKDLNKGSINLLMSKHSRANRYGRDW